MHCEDLGGRGQTKYWVDVTHEQVSGLAGSLPPTCG